MGRFELLMALLSVFIRPAIVNNTSAELATGGLVFTRNPAIEIRAEELFISLTEIRVRYVFFNDSNKDIGSTVAFPMPDITISDTVDIAIPTGDPQNIVGFNTVVAGRPVSTQVEQRPFARGVDQSALLRRLGIPLAPHIEETHAALRRLPGVELNQLINLGTREEERGAGLHRLDSVARRPASDCRLPDWRRAAVFSKRANATTREF